MKKYLLILLTAFSFSAQANYITLYFIHSPVGINWRTPQTLSKSTVANSIVPVGKVGRYSIGHVYEEISCPRLNYYEKTGQTSIGTEDQDRVVKLGWGLGAMIAETTGVLDSTAVVDAALPALYKKGRVAFLKVLLSDSACERVVEYMNEYRELKLDKIYAGLHARPLHKEGSGCSAFGASLLQVNNLLLPEQYSAWTQHLGVPYKYVGGPRTGKKVSLLKMLTAYGSEWTKKGDPNGLWIDFFDPDLMNGWVKDTHKKIKKGQSNYPFAVDAVVRNRAKGVIFDMTAYEAPTGPIFHE